MVRKKRIIRKKRTDSINPALLYGVSENDFSKLLNGIQSEISDIRIALGEYDNLINELQNNRSGEETDNWIEKFKTQITNSDIIINENLQNIESIFVRIFEDWEKSKKNSEKTLEDKGDNNG